MKTKRGLCIPSAHTVPVSPKVNMNTLISEGQYDSFLDYKRSSHISQVSCLTPPLKVGLPSAG